MLERHSQSSTQNCLIRLHGQQCEKFVRGILGIMPHLSPNPTSRLTRQRRWMGESFQKRGPGGDGIRLSDLMTASRTRSLSSSISWISTGTERSEPRSIPPQSLGSPSTKIGIFIFTGIDESIQHSFPHLAQGMDTAIPSNVYSSSVEKFLRALSNSGAAAVAEGPMVARAVTV